MDIAKKLRQVVTANFIEIVRSEEDERPKKGTPALNTVDSLPPVPTRVPSDNSAEAQAAAEMKARQELDELNKMLEARDDVDQTVSPVEAVSETPEGDEPAIAEAVEAPTADPVAIEAVEDTEDDTIEGVIAIPVETEVADAEPIPVEAEAAPTPEPTPAFDPMAYVNSDGTLDFPRFLKASNLPAVAFTAEQALKIITALPEDLPMRVKRSTVKATLQAVSPETVEDASDVLADAMLKRVHVGQLRDALAEHVEIEIRQRNEEIVRLRSELDRVSNEATEYQRRQKLFAESCENYINQFHQVVLFLQTEETNSQPVIQTVEEDEIPPFMREDTVFRLLGINDSENSSETTEDSAQNGRATSERGRGRR